MVMKYALPATFHVKHALQLKIFARVVTALQKERKKGIVAFVKMGISMIRKIKHAKNAISHVLHAKIIQLVKLVVFLTLIMEINSVRNAITHVQHVLELEITVVVVIAMLKE